MLFGIVERDDLRVSGVGDGLAEADDQSQQEESGEGMNQPGSGSGHRPHEITCGQKPINVQPIYQPAIDGLKTGVRPEKRRQQKAQLRRADSELVLEQRSGN